MAIGGHQEVLPAFVTKLGHYSLVLGIPWLRHHDVSIQFASNRVAFSFPRCLDRCMRKTVEVQGTAPSPTKPSIAMIAALTFQRMVANHKQRHGNIKAFSLSLYDINRALEQKKMETSEAFLEALDKAAAGAREAFEGTTEEHLKTSWRLLARGQVVLEAPRYSMIQDTFNHWAHHRGQMTVYLRLMGAKVPAIYGPSADDTSFK